MVIAVLLSSVNSFAQLKNAKTETVEINGNCAMCKATIEKAGNVKNIAVVNWDKNSKVATLNYDSEKTNQDEILKRIALAGYDNKKFRAPDDVYAKLPGCCQYDRELKTVTTNKEHKMDDHSGHANHDHETTMPATASSLPLKPVFDSYFLLKDALVKTDGKSAAGKASELVKAIKAVDMDKLNKKEHTAWMKLMKDLLFDAEHIAETKDVAHQRDHFTSLSKNMYDLIKATKLETSVYYQHCPMYDGGKGANWLSKENTVKNPYYGSQMLTCGSTVETIK